LKVRVGRPGSASSGVTSRDFADDPNSEEVMFQPFLQKPDSATATHRIIAASGIGPGVGA